MSFNGRVRYLVVTEGQDYSLREGEGVLLTVIVLLLDVVCGLILLERYPSRPDSLKLPDLSYQEKPTFVSVPPPLPVPASV